MFTNAQIISALNSKKIVSSNPDINNMYPWDASDDTATLEGVSTAQIEYFRKAILNENIQHFYSTSRVFVKDSNDSFYSSQGYPNPPIGAVFRSIDRNGNIPANTLVEIPPVIFIVDLAIRNGDLVNAEKALQFIDYMTVSGSFYGSPIKVVAGVAKYEQGNWVRKYDTIIMRSIYGAIFAYFRYANYTGSTVHAEKGGALLKTLALAVNNNIVRVARGELAPILEGALYAHMVHYGNNISFVWNRFTIEGNWFFWLAVNEAANWYGWDTQLTDVEDTPYTLRMLCEKVGNFYDNILRSGVGIMKHRNPRAPFLPYQFFIQQADYPYNSAVTGVNFDWTEESGTYFGDTYFVGDLELWGLIGMAYLINNNFMNYDINKFIYQFTNLAVNDGPYFHDRYDFLGRSLQHDPSISTVFTALYGILINIYPSESIYTPNIDVLSTSVVSNSLTLVLSSSYQTRIVINAFNKVGNVFVNRYGPYYLTAGNNTITIPYSPNIKLFIEDIG